MITYLAKGGFKLIKLFTLETFEIAKSDFITHCLFTTQFLLDNKIYIFQTDCPCKTVSIPPEETSNEVHPFQKFIFEPISVRRVFDLSTFIVTYIADIRGPADAISEFNGTVRRSL